MDFTPVNRENYPVLHELLYNYYLESDEDGTTKEEMDEFIELLLGYITDGYIQGSLAVHEGQTCGFVLWEKDEENSPFGQLPGQGTILEIGLVPEQRGKGLGRALVSHAEQAMQEQEVSGLYVCAFGPAQAFWKRCGYTPNGNTAHNGLPIYTK